MTRLLLIRHGDTDFVGRAFAGWLPDVHLNAQGHRQASALVRELEIRGLRPSAIYSSPLERALETAAPIAQRHELRVQVCEGLGELRFGHWTGRSFESLRDDPHFARFNAARSRTRVPDGEMMIEVQSRAVSALTAIAEEHPDACVAAVSHCDVIRSVLLYVLGMPLDHWGRIQIDPASLSVVDLGANHVQVVFLNVQTSTPP